MASSTKSLAKNLATFRDEMRVMYPEHRATLARLTSDIHQLLSDFFKTSPERDFFVLQQGVCDLIETRFEADLEALPKEARASITTFRNMMRSGLLNGDLQWGEPGELEEAPATHPAFVEPWEGIDSADPRIFLQTPDPEKENPLIRALTPSIPIDKSIKRTTDGRVLIPLDVTVANCIKWAYEGEGSWAGTIPLTQEDNGMTHLSIKPGIKGIVAFGIIYNKEAEEGRDYVSYPFYISPEAQRSLFCGASPEASDETTLEVPSPVNVTATPFVDGQSTIAGEIPGLNFQTQVLWIARLGEGEKWSRLSIMDEGRFFAAVDRPGTYLLCAVNNHPERKVGDMVEVTVSPPDSPASQPVRIDSPKRKTQPDLSRPEFDRVHAHFTNPVEQANWEQLTQTEQEQVYELTCALVRDVDVFTANVTKPHGLPRHPSAIDHCSYVIKGGSDTWENSEEISEQLKRQLGRTMINAIHTNSDSHDSIKILPHPSDPSRLILNCHLHNVFSSSSYDERSCFNQYTLVIDKESPVLDFLRSQQNPRSFSFALRYAGVAIKPTSIGYLNVPLEGNTPFDNPGNPLTILDAPNRTVIPFNSRHTPNFLPHTKVATNDSGFLNFSKTYKVAHPSPRFEWGGVGASWPTYNLDDEIRARYDIGEDGRFIDDANRQHQQPPRQRQSQQAPQRSRESQ
ncbi:hypothetical protein COY07_06285 [Candidatus Peregrinibacteria bacterium CG_4_10_14_0_2_um_filter_43_11]|nr:MAG: hypothetical protein COY07_06285 [Candidatus Peregrinibacteria bacterium CG_4_10_14_0_2_um_filter_43_11]